jgi:uncharacterized membrane protein
MTNSLAVWFADNLGHIMPAELVIFIVSLFPILECRGGLIVAALLGVDMWKAVPICIIGNVLPVPFLLILLERILQLMKKTPLRGMAEWIERRGERKSEGMKYGEFLGLLLFVGIPLPGTGAWTGSLIATVLDIDWKKAILPILMGVLMATVIMTVFSYAFLANVVG